MERNGNEADNILSLQNNDEKNLCKLECPQEDENSQRSVYSYRIIRVGNGMSSDGDTTCSLSTQMAATPSVSSVPSLQTVVANPIGGGLYVISSPADAKSNIHKPIAATQISAMTFTAAAANSPRRDDKRRLVHNAIERRRRDKINNWITELGQLLPENYETAKRNGDGSASCNDCSHNSSSSSSKSKILSKACDYISELQDITKKYEDMDKNLAEALEENKRLVDQVNCQRRHNERLEFENKQLRNVLEQHGLQIVIKTPQP